MIIFAKKIKGTYIEHGVKYAEGGLFATCDSGWSISQAIQYEENRLKPGTQYQIERNGKLVNCFFTK